MLDKIFYIIIYILDYFKEDWPDWPDGSGPPYIGA